MRPNLVTAKAKAAGWPMPARPPRDSPPAVFQEWSRLYRRLRWILKMNAEVVGNVRPGAKFARLRGAAKDRNLEVEFTLEQYTELVAGAECHYCGARLPATGHGIDRKNSSIGYVLANIVLACDACNRIKSDVFTYAQMVEIGNLLRVWRAQGVWTDPQRKDQRDAGGRPLKGNLRREIEEWNAKWAGDEPLRLAFGARSDGPGGSNVVRESGGAYTVDRIGAQLANEVDNGRTSLVRGPGGPNRLQTDWADLGSAGDVVAGVGLT